MPLPPNTRVILLDIEGTTSSIAYVYETLFPFVRREVCGYLTAHWNEAPTQSACERIARDAGAASFSAFVGSANPLKAILAEVFRLMDIDSKAGGLKELQGLVSMAGYQSGALRSHFYADVPPVLKSWTDKGLRCCVYSSGSVGAQKNFYRYAEAGDLTPYISANFDTVVGPKREISSYAAIASALKTAPGEILFFSDVTAELDAARAAGMQTVLVIRPGNKPSPANHGHREITSFDELR